MRRQIAIILFALFCLFPFQVHAATLKGIVTGTDVSVRPSPSTNEKKIGTVNKGKDELVVLSATVLKDESTSSNKCADGWYKVEYNGGTGYVCAAYLTVVEEKPPVVDNTEAKTACQNELKKLGFPSSYWDKLCTLKTSHPNWNFVPKITGSDGKTVDFVTAVISESSCGSSSITTSAQASFKGDSCNKKWDSGMTTASTTAVRYYLDPRNFLDEKNIFMFEDQNINKSIKDTDYKNATNKLFNNNFLVQQIPDFTEYIRVSANSLGVSQMAVASRIKQELGNAKLTSGKYKGKLFSVVSGDYTTRYNWYYTVNGNKVSIDHYYNFFNIAATDGSNVTQKALIYAYNHKWGGTGNKAKDRQTAMTGGVSFLKNSYIAVGQNTAYFQKFNIFPNNISSRFVHQYMTNVQAPVGEASILYNAYKAAGLLTQPFTFIIPVYDNLDTVVTIPSEGDPQESVGVSSAVVSSGYNYSKGYISKIPLGTTAEELKHALESKGVTVSIVDTSSKSATGTLGTGYKVSIVGDTAEVLEVVMYGDVSGDGKINAVDLLKVQKDILNVSKLSGAQKLAADINKDGKVNAVDLLKVQKDILNVTKIEQ